MGPFASRQVVLLPFPFSDLSASKLRLVRHDRVVQVTVDLLRA